MRVDRRLLGWGVFLILLGAIPLAVRAGYLSEDTVRQAWELWPLILIGIGLGLLLRRTRAAFVGGLVVAITFGLIAGSVLAVGIGGGFVGCNPGASGTAFEAHSGAFGPDADVEVDLSCGELTATAGQGSGWSLEGIGANGKGPDVATSPRLLSIHSPNQSWVGFTRGGQKWQLTLPTDPTLGFSLSVNAGSGRVDLAGVHVPSASVTVNAGDVKLDLSQAATVGTLSATVNAGSFNVSLPAASLTGSLTANLGSIKVCIPDGVGLRVRSSGNALGSYNFDVNGMTKTGDTWTSPDYEAQANQVDLSASANAGSISVNPEGGCD